MADYSLLGSFGTGGASALNGELLTKLKDAERGSVLFSIDSQLEDITGRDAETDEALATLGESDTLSIIKAQTLDLMAKMSAFDLDSTSTTAFDAVAANTTGTAAVFDAVDIGGLQPGTNNITITQLAQRDVYQSISFNASAKDTQMSSAQTSDDLGYVITTTNDVPDNQTDYDAYLNYVATTGINVEVDGETHFFSIVQDPTATTFEDLGAKTIQEMVAEINENEKLIASIETVGTDSYRLVIKSTDSGKDNALKISQTNISLGFEDNQYSSKEVADTAIQIEDGNDVGDLITINGVNFSTEGKTYDQLAIDINDYDSGGGVGDTFDASIVNGQIVITTDDASGVTITQTGVDMGFYNSNDSHTQIAQNLEANVDGIDYDISSNTLTIQGNLTMTAVEIGTSTIDIQKDTTTILTSVESMISSYNALVDLISEETGKADSVMNDSSSLRSLLSSIKDNLFGSYGENNDLNLFNFGLELDLTGHLSLDSTEFGEALIDNYDDIKNLFLGNTVDEDLASSDATKYLGMGTIIQDFLDELDASDGIMTRYETSIASRQEQLEEAREKAIKTLDTKYESMAAQFSLYGSAITQMESSFAGLESMIKQSYVSK